MSTPHPSLILRMDIDQREFTDSLKDEIRRSYSYVATSTVGAHEPVGDDLENILRYDIKLRQDYWDETDAQQQETWESCMPKFLRNMIVKVDNTVRAANETYVERGRNPICYAWTEFKFADNALLAFKVKRNCTLGVDRVAAIENIRHLMSTGQLGEGIACVRVPSRASYEAQKAALLESIAEKERAEAQVETLAAEGTEIPVELQSRAQAEIAGEVLVQADDVALWERSVDPEQKGGEACQAVPAEGADLETQPQENRYVNFDADDAIWGIEYRDGTVREYDSRSGCFIL